MNRGDDMRGDNPYRAGLRRVFDVRDLPPADDRLRKALDAIEKGTAPQAATTAPKPPGPGAGGAKSWPR